VLGAFGFYFQNWLFEYVLFIDDPVSAAAVHMGAGFVGVLLPAFLASSDYVEGDHVGIFYGGNGKQLGWQIAAILVYFLWAFGACSLLVFWPLSKLGMLRVSEGAELEGLDMTHHGGSAYNYHPKTTTIADSSSEGTRKPLEALAGDYVSETASVIDPEILKMHPGAITPGAS
jgi:ammonium transporter, Amt family